MSQATLARGRWGEQQAASWYRRHGYAIVEQNWREPSLGEIDLVVSRPGLIVISEVKTRRTDRFGPPTLAVGETKQRRLRRLAAAWLAARDVHGVDVRFDVVAITGTTVEVIEGAF